MFKIVFLRRCTRPFMVLSILMLIFSGVTIVLAQDEYDLLDLQLAGIRVGEPTTPIYVTLSAGKSIAKQISGDASDIASFHYHLYWDPAIASYEGALYNDDLFSVFEVTPQPGDLEVWLDGGDGHIGPPVSPSRTALVRHNFRLKDRVGSTPVTVNILRITDIDGRVIDYLPPDPFSFTIGCPAGDVVPNGEVDAMDALAILRYTAGMVDPDPIQYCRADINLNGYPDAGDAVLALRQAVGLEKSDSSYEFRSTGENPSRIVEEFHGRYEFTMNDVAGFDCWLEYDPSQVNVVDWKVEGALSGVTKRAPGVFRLAFASGEACEATLSLQLTGSGSVDLKQLRAWNEGGDLAQEITDESLQVEDDIATVNGTHLLRCYPSPFNSETTIQFYQQDAGPARIEIIDARGRVVWAWHTVENERGRIEIPWHAVDLAGRPVASGVYRVVLRTGGVSSSWPVSLVR